MTTTWYNLIRVPILTDASGDFSYNTGPVNGKVYWYRYVPHGTSPLDTGADLSITGKTSGIVVANQSNIGTSAFTKAPRQATHDETGAASLYADSGEPVEDKIAIGNEQLSVVIAQGGAAKLGTLYICVGP